MTTPALEQCGTVLAVSVGVIGLLGNHFARKKRGKRWILIVSVALILLGGAVAIGASYQKDVAEGKTPKYAGDIEPGSETAAPLPNDVPRDTVQLLLGDNLRLLTAKQPTYVISNDGKQFLTLSERDGNLLITATLLDSTGRVMTRIIDNEFQANPETTFKPKQPDKHSLIVRDTEGREVLHVRFLNPKALWITGRFVVDDQKEPVVIDPVEGLMWAEGRQINQLTLDATGVSAGALDVLKLTIVPMK